VIPRKFRAPGRVNLIGEHTDYNDGFVLPVALDLYCEVEATLTNDGRLRVRALDIDQDGAWRLDELASAAPRRDWSDYVVGVARELAARGVRVPAAELAIHSTVPIGAGLSSSAALEVAVGLALSSLVGVELPGEDLARAALAAEKEFAGLHCGIMDQFIAVFGKRDHAVLIDCRSLEHRAVPLPTGLSLAMVDSGVRHELASSEYNVRRQECEEAARRLGRSSLREVSAEEWRRREPELDDPYRSRARHIIEENDRVLAFVEAAAAGEMGRLGELMAESHRSLSEDYAVSCPELDFLAAEAPKIDGVIGSRMTGGGFGGCTVNLVRPDEVEDFSHEISQRYEERFGRPARTYVCESGDGARETP